MRKLTIALLLLFSGVVGAGEISKKYRMKIGDQTLIVELEEIPAPQPEPTPTPTPTPTPIPTPVPPPMPMPDHSVKVMRDAVMMGHESTPRFAVGAKSVAVKSGNWSDATTWSTPPSIGESVQIPENITVTYDVKSANELGCIEVSGCLEVSDTVDTELWTSEIMVLPSGCLCVEPKDKHCEIVFPDGPLRTTDVGQSGRGLIVFGEITVQGKPISQTFMRSTSDIEAGSLNITLTNPVDWTVGSQVVIPDTRQTNPTAPNYVPQWEVRKVVAFSGKTVTLDRPLTYAHRGPRDMDGTPTKGFDGKVLTPHVACLSRSVVIRSEKPEGTRGHVQLIANAKVSIKHAEFKDLGRTKPGPLGDDNHIGRYALHCHHLVGRPGGIDGHQFVLEGNAIVGGLKWGITVHDSHYGLIRGNVVYDVDGAGIATEIGSETGNVFESNFVCKINGNPGILPSNGLGELTFEGGPNRETDLGDQGDGFWFPGPMNKVHNNVVTNVRRSAYTVWPDGMPNDPNSRIIRPVQSPISPLGELRTINLLAVPFDDFVDNEAYGAITSAIQLWSVGDRRSFPGPGVNTLRNTTAWHITGVGLRFYYSDSCIVDGWLQRGDTSMIGRSIMDGGESNPSRGEAMTHAGSLARVSNASRVDIQGHPYGYIQRGHGYTDEVDLGDAVLDNVLNIEVRSWAEMPPDGSSDNRYRNILFKDTYSPGSLRAIQMIYNPLSEKIALCPETHTVIDYQQIKGLNLDLYYYEQAPGSKPAMVPDGGIPKGRWAPTITADGDKGEAAKARGKAMGIEGLVFVTSKPTNPLVFANVLLENNQPTLYYAVLCDEDTCEVTVDIDGTHKTLTGKTGNMPIAATNGLHLLKVECDCGASVTKPVQFPVKK